MSDTYLVVDLEDSRTASIADVISNKTCKKILGVLASKEMTESDIAKALNIPLNTVGYNIKKLVNSGLVEKSKKYFWSTKGKKIPTYVVSQKKIVISPKSFFKGIVPAAVISGALGLVVRVLYSGEVSRQTSSFSTEAASVAIKSAPSGVSLPNISTGAVMSSTAPVWLWFVFGAFTALLIFLLWNWRKL